jgi:hypothetical protein
MALGHDHAGAHAAHPVVPAAHLDIGVKAQRVAHFQDSSVMRM